MHALAVTVAGGKEGPIILVRAWNTRTDGKETHFSSCPYQAHDNVVVNEERRTKKKKFCWRIFCDDFKSSWRQCRLAWFSSLILQVFVTTDGWQPETLSLSLSLLFMPFNMLHLSYVCLIRAMRCGMFSICWLVVLILMKCGLSGQLFQGFSFSRFVQQVAKWNQTFCFVIINVAYG